MQTLDYQERIMFALRALYDRHGYRPYKMSKFEEYDLYARNKDFLISDSVITFTDLSGKLMALKPDVTLSIVKNTTDTDSAVQKLYYNENVYRVSKGTRTFRELMQVGLECLGNIDDYSICEVLLLAAKSLLEISDACILDISHLGLLSELIDAVGIPRVRQAAVYKAISEKNLHEMESLCKGTGVAAEDTALLLSLLKISGSIAETLPKIRQLLSSRNLPSLEQFLRIASSLEDTEVAGVLRIDFSVVDDIHYYNGIVFKGFISGIPSSVLSGGQYDKLMRKMGRRCGAVGFAVYTDALERFMEDTRPYDVDTVLLYPKDTSPKAVFQGVNRLAGQGISVLALNELPENLRYRQLLRLEVKDLADHA